MDLMWMPLIISAFGGAIAALFLRALLRLVRKWGTEWKPLAVYGCADSTWKQPGLLTQGRGYPAEDATVKNRKVWMHTPDAYGEGLVHTIYGPYVNDFGKPGYYRVCFRIYGSGFFENDTTPIIILDVIERPIFMRDEIVVLGQRLVRAKDLAEGEPRYKKYNVYCYAAGSGTYEYRCQVTEAFDPKRHILRFDVIEVYAHVPAWEIF